MKKKKYPEDLMEEDLMETIQHRINELTAELKLLNAAPTNAHRAVLGQLDGLMVKIL